MARSFASVFLDRFFGLFVLLVTGEYDWVADPRVESVSPSCSLDRVADRVSNRVSWWVS